MRRGNAVALAAAGVLITVGIWLAFGSAAGLVAAGAALAAWTLAGGLVEVMRSDSAKPPR